VGGRTRTITTPGGYRFDIGPTFFLYPRILADIFAACGERLEDWIKLQRLHPQYHLVFEGGGESRATSDIAKLKARIARLAARPTLRPFSTVDRDLRRYFADPRVRLAFSFQTKYLGMSPFQCPSLFTILSFLEYEHGVYHPVGGCGAVSEAMAALARRMGVDIRLGTAVDRVVYRDGRAVGVEAGGKHVFACAVVVNGDFGHAARQLIPEIHRPRWRDPKLKRAQLSCSTFMMYL